MKHFETYINRLPSDLVKNLKECRQSPKWHPEGVVYNHIKLVFEYADTHFHGNNELLVSSIFHDLGKLDTSEIKIKDGIEKITHHGHEIKSLKYIDKYFHLFSDLTIDKDKVFAICKNHMKAHLYDSGKLKKIAKREAFENLPDFEDIMNFNTCDSNGR